MFFIIVSGRCANNEHSKRNNMLGFVCRYCILILLSINVGMIKLCAYVSLKRVKQRTHIYNLNTF